MVCHRTFSDPFYDPAWENGSYVHIKRIYFNKIDIFTIHDYSLENSCTDCKYLSYTIRKIFSFIWTGVSVLCKPSFLMLCHIWPSKSNLMGYCIPMGKPTISIVCTIMFLPLNEQWHDQLPTINIILITALSYPCINIISVSWIVLYT